MITTTIRKNEYGEWHVRVRVNGKRMPNQDYHTNDKSDAEITARLIREGK